MTAILPNGNKTPREGRFLFTLGFGALASFFLAFSWLAPNHYPPWTSFHGEAAAFAALIFFCAARLVWARPLVSAGAPVGIACGLLLLIAVQWPAGQIAYGGDAFLSGMYVAGWALAWWLGVNSTGLAAKLEAESWLAWIVVLAAAAAVLLALLQWLRMEGVLGIFAAERDYDVRPYSNLGQPNHTASLVLMATALSLLLHARGKLKSWQSVTVVLWLSLGLTLTESRSGLIAAFCMGALALIKGRNMPGMPRWRWVGAWWALLLILAWAWPLINELMYLLPPRGALAAGDSGRLVIWKQCLAGIEASPWTGYGWRQSIVGQKMGAATIPGWTVSDYAHNVFLDLCLWVGVPLGLGIGGVAAWWLLRTFMRARGNSEALLFGAVLPLLVHSMLEFPFAYSYFLFPAAWILGLLARMQQTRESSVAEPDPGRRRRLRAALFLVLYAAAAVTLFSEYLEAEEDYRVMRFELRRVGRRPADYQPPELLLLTQLDETLKLGRLVPRAHMSEEEIDRLRKASVSFTWATLHLRYAVALGLNGQPEKASNELRLLRNSYGAESYEHARKLWGDMKAQNSELASVLVP